MQEQRMRRVMIKRLICRLFGHARYFVVQEDHTYKGYCTRCGKRIR